MASLGSRLAFRAPAAVHTAGSRRDPVPVEVFPLYHSARMTDLLVSMLLIGHVVVPGLPVGAFDQLGLFILVLFGIFRRPLRAVPVWYPVTALGLMSFLIFESAINGIETGALVQRALNISLSLVTVGFLASGRIDVASMMKGIAIALVGNAVLFYAGIAPHPYGQFLTGYLADKNVSGLYFATVPLLIAAAYHRWWQRVAVVVLSGGALWLTGSRTSMAAYVAVLIWICVSLRGNWWVKLGTGGALYAAFLYASDHLAHIGEFADREGSDIFRAQIDAATFAKVAETPWYGKGLSEATVTLPNEAGTWFFHNSYAALWVEGGIVMTAVVIGLYGGAMLALARWTGGAPRIASRLLGRPAPSERAFDPSSPIAAPYRGRFDRIAAAGAIGSVLLCSLRLGEVFMEQAGFIVLGIAFALLCEGRSYQASPWAVGAVAAESSGTGAV